MKNLMLGILVCFTTILSAQPGPSNSVSYINVGPCESASAVSATFALDENCQNLTWAVTFCGSDRGCSLGGQYEMLLEVGPQVTETIIITIPANSPECITMTGVLEVNSSKVILVRISNTTDETYEDIYTGPPVSVNC